MPENTKPAAVTSSDGLKQYSVLIDFSSKGARQKFQKHALAALDAHLQGGAQ